MLTLADQIRRKAHVYAAHGGKTNRRQQIARIIIVASWIQDNFSLTRLEQIGKRQIIEFWKAHRGMAPGTAYGYWLALQELWRWLGRGGVPPAPRNLPLESGLSLRLSGYRSRPGVAGQFRAG